jgi:hypothetical protein
VEDLQAEEEAHGQTRSLQQKQQNVMYFFVFTYSPLLSCLDFFLK